MKSIVYFQVPFYNRCAFRLIMPKVQIIQNLTKFSSMLTKRTLQNCSSQNRRELAFVICFMALLIHVRSWRTVNLMQNFFTQNNISDQFVDYSLKKVAINSTDYLIIFGGRETAYSSSSNLPEDIVSDRLFLINLATFESVEFGANSAAKPQPRYLSCGIFQRDIFYIYGGFNMSHTLQNQLWSFDFSSAQWSFIDNSDLVLNCEMISVQNMYDNDTIAILGLNNSTKKFEIIEYYILNNNFIKTSLQIFSGIELLGTLLWDGELVDTSLRIVQTYDVINTDFVVKDDFQFLLNEFCTVSNRTLINVHYLVTNTAIFILQKESNIYTVRMFLENNYSGDSPLKCEVVSSYFLFVHAFKSVGDSNKLTVAIEYYETQFSTTGYFLKDRGNYYGDWLPEVYDFETFSHNEIIYLINENLETYALDKNCQNTQASPNLLKCIFQVYNCEPDYTGSTCELKICPNSLILLDANGMSSVYIECSENGKCTQNGCLCNENWTGDGCQIFARSNCEGTLIKNFIASNCECTRSNVGGNQCNVVFCYNDCSGKGTCQPTGECLCDAGYKGADCSILEVDFALI